MDTAGLGLSAGSYEGVTIMCGIVGAIAERNIVPILMEGLRRLEYRGYDSAGIAVVDDSHHLARLRTVGKVQALQDALDREIGRDTSELQSLAYLVCRLLLEK